MKKIKLALVAMAGIFCFVCGCKEEAVAKDSSTDSRDGKEEAVTKSSFKDPYDGKTYKTVKIGTETWMAENLNYAAKGSKCYNNSGANCDKYGRLYDWNTAMKACPKGWHLPSDTEWDRLLRFAAGTSGTESPYGSATAGKLLKAKNGWNDYEGKSGNGTDNYGFAALPGGYGSSGGSFSYVGDSGYWWSASEYDAYGAYRRDMYYNYASVYRGNYDKSFLYSVRCVQD